MGDEILASLCLFFIQTKLFACNVQGVLSESVCFWLPFFFYLNFLSDLFSFWLKCSFWLMFFLTYVLYNLCSFWLSFVRKIFFSLYFLLVFCFFLKITFMSDLCIKCVFQANYMLFYSCPFAPPYTFLSFVQVTVDVWVLYFIFIN